MRSSKLSFPLWIFPACAVMFAGMALLFLSGPASTRSYIVPTAVSLIFTSMLATVTGVHVRSLTQRIDQLEKTLAERDKEL